MSCSATLQFYHAAHVLMCHASCARHRHYANINNRRSRKL